MRSEVTAGIVDEALTCASAHRLQAPAVISIGDGTDRTLQLNNLLHLLVWFWFRQPPEATEINRAALVDQV
jgi:hypothetical protein